MTISIAFQTDKTPSEYIALAKLVNQYDFGVVSVYCDTPFHPSYGPLLLMAPHITRARLGPAAVSVSRMAPVDIAADTALLAQLAMGGVYIGLARGAWLAEHGIQEVERPIQAIREAVSVIRYMLSGDVGGYQGKMYHVAPHVRAPYALPVGPVPMMIGSWGRKLCAVAGEVADEVKIGGTANPDVVPLIRDYVGEGERRAGRAAGSVGVVAGAVSVLDEDRELARELARRAVALYLPVVMRLDPTVSVAPELIIRLREYVEQQDTAKAARLISDDLLDRFALSGNATDIIHQAEALYSAGVNRIEFGTPHGLTPETGIHMLGEQVIPALRPWTKPM